VTDDYIHPRQTIYHLFDLLSSSEVDCHPVRDDIELKWKIVICYGRLSALLGNIHQQQMTFKHLRRIGILEIQLCECGEDYETMDHMLWRCGRFQAQRRHLVDELKRLGIPSEFPVRDLMESHNWKGLQACSSFFNAASPSLRLWCVCSDGRKWREYIAALVDVKYKLGPQIAKPKVHLKKIHSTIQQMMFICCKRSSSKASYFQPTMTMFIQE
jgi:hypothetical protein